MAGQNQITYIRRDPSAARVSDVFSDWSQSAADGTVKMESTVTTIGMGSTQVDGTYYSKELSLKGRDVVSVRVQKSATTGSTGVTTTWQWFNPSGTSYDGTGDQVGGVWTDITAPSTTGITYIMDPTVNAEWEVIQKASKFRFKIICSSASADISSTINAAAFISADVAIDRTAELNLPIVAAYSGQTVAGSFGGIGADPS